MRVLFPAALSNARVPCADGAEFWARGLVQCTVFVQAWVQCQCRRTLTAERLADAIRAAQAPAMAAQAAAVGERIRAEDGAARAVDLVEQEHAAWRDHRRKKIVETSRHGGV